VRPLLRVRPGLALPFGEAEFGYRDDRFQLFTLLGTFAMLRTVALRLFSVILATGAIVADLDTLSVMAQQPITPGEKTTVWSQPRLPDGGLDFAGALNQFGMRRTPPERNGLVPMLDILIAEDFYGPGSYAALRGELGLTDPPKTSAQFYRPDDEMRSMLRQAATATWTRQENREVSDWLASNERALGKVDDVIARGGWFYPVIDTQMTLASGEQIAGIYCASLDVLDVLRDMATALAARSLMRYGEGRPDEGLRDVLRLHGIAEMLATSEFSLAALLMAVIDDHAREVVQALLQSNALRPADYSALYQALQGRPPINPDLVVLTTRDIIVSLEALDGLARGRFRETGVYLHHTSGLSGSPDRQDEAFDSAKHLGIRNWDQVALDLRQTLTEIHQALREKTNLERNRRLLQIQDRGLKQTKSKTGSELGQRIRSGEATDSERSQPIRLALTSYLFLSLYESVNGVAKIQMSRQIALTALLIEAFRQRSGRLPESLDELTPKLLRAVPKDLFDSQPLRYQKQGGGYKLYSVGAIAKDLGGPDPENPRQGNFGIVVAGRP